MRLRSSYFSTSSAWNCKESNISNREVAEDDSESQCVNIGSRRTWAFQSGRFSHIFTDSHLRDLRLKDWVRGLYGIQTPMERKSSLSSHNLTSLESEYRASVKWGQLGWLLIVAACCIFCILVLRGRHKYVELCRDFIPIYTGSRCVLHGCSPYDPGALYHEFVSAGGTGFNPRLWTNGVSVYPPTTFIVALPLAPLAVKTMGSIWMSIVLLGVCGTALLMADLAADYAVLAAAVPIAVLLCSITIVGELGQPAAIEVGILGVSLWAAVKQKWPLATGALLTIGFVFKPQLAVALALWMFLQPGYKRRVVLRASAAAVVIICATLILFSARPATRSWFPQLMSSIATVQQPHHYDANGVETKLFNSNFIGPENPDSESMTDVQVVAAVWSLRWANAISAAVFFILISIWGWAWRRAPKTYDAALIALGSLCPLTLLPIYHRQYDAVLLLLSMPAVSILWRYGKLWGLYAITVASLAAILVSDRYMNFIDERVHTKSQFVLATVLRSPVWGCLCLAIFFIVALAKFARPLPDRFEALACKNRTKVAEILNNLSNCIQTRLQPFEYRIGD